MRWVAMSAPAGAGLPVGTRRPSPIPPCRLRRDQGLDRSPTDGVPSKRAREPAYLREAGVDPVNSSECSDTASPPFQAIGGPSCASTACNPRSHSRQTEIATTAARIGFGGAPVVVSSEIEALVLALVGGARRRALAYIYARALALALNFNTFSPGGARFPRVTRGSGAGVLDWAIQIGAVGGSSPR